MRRLGSSWEEMIIMDFKQIGVIVVYYVDSNESRNYRAFENVVLLLLIP